MEGNRKIYRKECKNSTKIWQKAQDAFFKECRQKASGITVTD